MNLDGIERYISVRDLITAVVAALIVSILSGAFKLLVRGTKKLANDKKLLRKIAKVTILAFLFLYPAGIGIYVGANIENASRLVMGLLVLLHLAIRFSTTLNEILDSFADKPDELAGEDVAKDRDG